MLIGEIVGTFFLGKIPDADHHGLLVIPPPLTRAGDHLLVYLGA